MCLIAIPGADATAHMAEETRQASSVVPRAMLWSFLINSGLTFVMLITYLFCLTDLADALDSPTGFPFMQVFAATTGSVGASATLSSLIIITAVIATTNYMASTSRQVFAFARDHGLPFHAFISKASGSCCKFLHSSRTDYHAGQS